MANWCSNHIEISGGINNVEKVMSLFRDLEIKGQRSNLGQQLPFQSESSDKYFFNTSVIDEYRVFYETKWIPIVEELEELSLKYKVKVILEYCELGSFEYGRIVFDKGGILHHYLLQSDFQKYKFLEDKEGYEFEGSIFESEEEILEILLDRRIAILPEE